MGRNSATREQRAIRMFATLLSTADLSEVPDVTIDWVNGNRGEAGEEFGRFLKHCGNLAQLRAARLSQPKVLGTFKIGTGLRNGDAFRSAIRPMPMTRIADWADDLLDSPDFRVSGTEQALELVTHTPEELGFIERVPLGDICARAFELGRERCPAEFGPQLRLQITNQPLNERLVIVMDPIGPSNGGAPLVFVVERAHRYHLLEADHGDPNRLWGLHDKFVFVRGKS